MKVHNTATARSAVLRKINHDVTTRAPADAVILLEEVLQAMSPDDQAVLVAHYAYGYSFAEIAEVMNKHVRTIGWRAEKALAHVREKLGIEGAQ